MSEPFLGQITMVGFNFAPKNYAFCDGQILPIAQNQSLFSLFGTTYGGDGRSTFGLPDLRGRVPLHVGGSLTIQGAKLGVETVTLTGQEIPSHTHQLKGTNNATGGTNQPEGKLLASAGTQVYATAQQLQGLLPATVSSVGGQGHNNMQPFLTISFCVCMFGVFPSRN